MRNFLDAINYIKVLKRMKNTNIKEQVSAPFIWILCYNGEKDFKPQKKQGYHEKRGVFFDWELIDAKKQFYDKLIKPDMLQNDNNLKLAQARARAFKIKYLLDI